jgi:tRNA 2-thiocytidine biosynthesis protein TtcA
MRLEEKIRRLVGKGLFGYELLKDGDHVLVALSGGEDSLVLTHFLSYWKDKVRIRAKLTAIHLDMGFPKEEDKYLSGISFLRAFCEERGIEFIFEKTNYGLQAISAFDEGRANPCFVCSWHRRKHLFRIAERLEANKLALGHHQDDVLTTFFMNLFFHGELSALVPSQEMFKGKLYIIRPLYFVEKHLISSFVAKKGWQVLENPCPFSKETMRNAVNKLLQEKVYPLNPKVKKSIFRSLFNPRLDYLPKPPKKKFE